MCSATHGKWLIFKWKITGSVVTVMSCCCCCCHLYWCSSVSLFVLYSLLNRVCWLFYVSSVTFLFCQEKKYLYFCKLNKALYCTVVRIEVVIMQNSILFFRSLQPVLRCWCQLDLAVAGIFILLPMWDIHSHRLNMGH